VTPPLQLGLSVGLPALWLLPAVAAAAGLAWWAYPPGDSPLSPRLRRGLRALRGGGWLLVFLILLGPVVRWPELLAGRFRVLLLLDRSYSMDLAAAPAATGGGRGPTRAEVARRVAAALRRELGGRYDVLERGFARTLADTAAAGPAFRGATALGDVLAASGGLAAGRPAVLVAVSDGAVTQGQEPWSGAERLGLPVYAVLPGDSSAAPDAAVRELAANSTAYVHRPSPVRVTLEARGLAGRATALELREGPRLLARQELRLPRAGESEVAFTVTPETPGVHFYDVTLAPVPGELTALNNRRLFALDVLADKARVVLVQAAPSFDFSFLRRSLEEEPDLAPEFWIAGPGGSYLRPGSAETATPAALAARLGGAAVVVLGDLHGAPGLPQVLAAAAARVRAGAGLWVYGGGAGLEFYAGTPLEPLLPYALRNVPAGGTVALSPVPAPEARGDALFGEDGADPALLARWSELPPAAGVRPLSLRAGGRRLLMSPRGSAVIGAVLSPPGGGRVFALNAGQLYRWTFTAQGAPGGSDVFPAFLSRVWRWLNEPGAGPALAVRPARRVAELGEALEVEVTGQAAGDRVTLEAVPEAGRGVPLAVEGLPGGAARAEATLPAGRYRLVARAWRGEREVARAQAEAAVESTGEEWIESAPDAPGLRRTALASGGRFFTAADTAALAEALAREARRPRGAHELALPREPWPYALALLCFGAEWWIRRRRGLP